MSRGGAESLDFAAVDALLEESRGAGAFPGGVVAVGGRSGVTHLRPFGHLTRAPGAPAVEAGTLYDLASLTKVIVTTTVAMALLEEGKLHLEDAVRAHLPAFRGGARDRVRVRDLLTHSSGLPATAPLYRTARGPGDVLAGVLSLELEAEPGRRSTYSDPGFILLGAVLERAAGAGLEELARRKVLDPLGLRETLYRPGEAWRPRIAPTEDDPWRGHVLHGEVHDENAFAMGGVAPHAGLFGTAGDVARFARALLGGGRLEGVSLVSPGTLTLFTTRAGVPGSSRALGWDTPSEGSSAGRLVSSSAYGHTGFTGTSLWLDPTRDLFILLLTNRVHPTRKNDLIRSVRPAVADAVVRVVDGARATG